MYIKSFSIWILFVLLSLSSMSESSISTWDFIARLHERKQEIDRTTSQNIDKSYDMIDIAVIVADIKKKKENSKVKEVLEDAELSADDLRKLKCIKNALVNMQKMQYDQVKSSEHGQRGRSNAVYNLASRDKPLTELEINSHLDHLVAVGGEFKLVKASGTKKLLQDEFSMNLSLCDRYNFLMIDREKFTKKLIFERDDESGCLSVVENPNLYDRCINNPMMGLVSNKGLQVLKAILLSGEMNRGNDESDILFQDPSHHFTDEQKIKICSIIDGLSSMLYDLPAVELKGIRKN
jgi:hypothetical protein